VATIIDNAKEKTKLLEDFLESTRKIRDCLDNVEDVDKFEQITKEVGKRDKIISEINIINKVIGNAVLADGGQKSELEKENRLWFKLMDEIQKLEEENTSLMEGLKNGYMSKVKSAKESIKVIDAYSRQMTEEDGGAIDKSK